MNEPVAWMALFTTRSELGNIQIPDLCLTKPPSHLYDEVIPLYMTPQKYCPSENNAAYEKGFIDGMAKQRDSKVQQFVEAYVNKEDGLVCAKCYKPFTEMLTDEEIWDWFKENTALTKESALMIAKAILRKAQEK